MKNKSTRKSFDKFSSRAKRTKSDKERAKRELMRAVMECGVGTDSLKLSLAYDNGRRARVSDRAHRDEVVAEGVFSSSKSGFGFVTLEGAEGDDIFIPEDKTGGAIEGDRVEIVYHTYYNRFGEEKTEGRVRKILKYGKKTVIGTVDAERGYAGRRAAPKRLVLIPDDAKIPHRFIISNTDSISVGDKVEAKISRSASRYMECTVIKSFGNTYSREANYGAILAECEIEVDFSREELSEAEFFAAMPISDEGRVRRTKDIIFTIDGADAKDLDDAVSLKRLRDGGYQLGVHIADVSHYVRERTHLDRAVMARGTSVYFTDKVVPMLPPVLSNGVCSLNVGEEKYTLSAIINISANGEILSAKIEPSVIKSRVRGVYSEVNEIFGGAPSAQIKEKYKDVIPTLMTMRELYALLKEKSDKRGALELETTEAKIILSDTGEPVSIVKRERGDAEKMIEQFMLCANEAVAIFLSEREIPCVYRVHEPPPAQKLSEFITYAHNLGFDTSVISRENATSRDFSGLLEKAREREIALPVSYSMLRAMSKAKYSDVKRAHFGLGIESYCHFTSPIRRLSDLATHRIIHKVLLEDKRPALYAAYARRAAAAASEAELRALSAERRIENLYKVLYMEKFIGEEFDAVINSVTSFGLFAELENTCEGLIPISELPGDFIFDEKNLTLRSRKMTYHLGDSIRIKVEEADRIRGKLRFSVV